MSPKREQVSKEEERCWEHAVIYRMSCGLSHDRGRRPEVKREWEMLGPRFPHLRKEMTMPASRGDGAHEQKQRKLHAKGRATPAVPQVLGWEAGWLRSLSEGEESH